MPGVGKPGYCSICARPEGNIYVKGAQEGWTSKQAMTVAGTYDFTFTRQTWAKHAEHAKTPEQRVIQAAEKLNPERALTISKTSNQDFLEAVRDIGMRQIRSIPGEVTVDHALKAVQILEAKKEKKTDAMTVFVLAMTNHTPAYVIEGEAREVGETDE